MQAVMEHKVKTGTTKPYFYIDPKKGILYRLQGDKILYSSPIATGVNQNLDGWSSLEGGYDRSKNTSSTPAGIFTLSEQRTYKNEPSYHLVEAKRGNSTAQTTNVAIHAPVTQDRAKRLKNGETKLTFGCIQLPTGEMKCLTETNRILPGDSVYVEPTEKGNYLYEDIDGKIKTHFKATPSNVSGVVWGKKFNRNDVKYNIGY